MCLKVPLNIFHFISCFFFLFSFFFLKEEIEEAKLALHSAQLRNELCKLLPVLEENDSWRSGWR